MSLRGLIFWVHLICGITIGTVIMVVSVTGMLLAFRPQVMASVEKNHQTMHDLAETRVSHNELVAKILELYPGSEPGAVTVRSKHQAAVIINLGREHGTIYVDPYTAAILGKEAPAVRFMEQVEAWHRWLNLGGTLKTVGHDIKGICTIVFMAMVMSGLYLWWPHKTVRLNTRVRGQAGDWNRHNVIGFWSAPFLIVIALTGIMMSYRWASDLLYRVSGNPPPVVEVKSKPAGGKQVARLDFDALFAQARDKVPGWVSMTARPGKPEAVANITIEEPGVGLMPQRSQLSIEGLTGTVVKWEPYAGQNLGRKLRLLARYLHTGEVGGVAGQILAFLSAGAAVMMVWTGFAMAWRRFFSPVKY